ncbi:ribonuclease H-like domain-containing protein [Tanacetum coccineum]
MANFLTKSGLKTVNTAKQNSSRAAVLVNTARPINQRIPKNNVTSRKATHQLENVTTVRTKAVVSDNKGNEANAVKASTCSVWRPKDKVLDHGNPQLKFQEKEVIDSGCSRHMTGNKSYLSYYEEIDDGFVTFGGNPKGGKITGKATKDETSGILKDFITGIENQRNHIVKIIRYDNGTEFKNKEMNQFCEMKGIKREFSVARTPQQNGDEAVNTACYVQNRVLVIKSHNKTPYELFNGRPPIISFMRPFGCLVTILNTLDHLGKFDGNADEGFFVGYFVNSKAFRVFNSRTRIVEETLHITFLENKPNVTGSGLEWLFDIDTLTKSMNYKPVFLGNQTNGNTGTKESIDAGQAEKKTVPSHKYILLPLRTPDSPISSILKSSDDKVANNVEKKTTEDPPKEDDKDDQNLREFKRLIVQGK